MKLVAACLLVFVGCVRAGLVIHPLPDYATPGLTAISETYSSVEHPIPLQQIPQQVVPYTAVQEVPQQVVTPVVDKVVPDHVPYTAALPYQQTAHVPALNNIAQPQLQYQPEYVGSEPVNNAVNPGLRGIQYVTHSDDTPSSPLGGRRSKGKYWVADSDGTRKPVDYSAADLNGPLQPQIPAVTLVSKQSLYNGITNGITEAIYDKKTPLTHALNSYGQPNPYRV